MDFRLNQIHLSDLKVQRNILLGICSILLSINAIQSLCLVFRRERVIITPPQMSQGFWVEGNQFSPQYLEEMALHYAHFLLDVTEKNILYQGEILLRYVIPESYGVFKSKLLEDEKNLKKNALSTRFCPVESKISPHQLAVEITGDLMSYVADKRVSTVRETYQLRFQNRSGRLLIESFTCTKTDKKQEIE